MTDTEMTDTEIINTEMLNTEMIKTKITDVTTASVKTTTNSQILRIDGYIQNIYMVIYPDKILLLDGCCRADVDLVIDTIRHMLGRDVSELKAVVVTHMHADHAGGAGYLRQRTGCQIISTDQSSQWYAGLKGRINHLLDLSLSYLMAYRQGNRFANLMYPADLYPDIVVKEGDVLPMFEDWQVICTAGHTDRDISLYQPSTGKIYVADLILQLDSKKRGQRLVNPYHIHLPDIYKQSLHKVKALQPKMVMMAHGSQMYVSPDAFDELVNIAPNQPRTNRDVYRNVVFRIRR